MTGFDKGLKNTSLYLDVAANGSGRDKSWLTLEALRRLPDSDRRIDMAEIGPGGGSALEALVDTVEKDLPQQVGRLGLKLIELDGIESKSLKKARSHFDRIGSSELLRGDAQGLDRRNFRTLDIILIFMAGCGLSQQMPNRLMIWRAKHLVFLNSLIYQW